MARKVRQIKCYYYSIQTKNNYKLIHRIGDMSFRILLLIFLFFPFSEAVSQKFARLNIPFSASAKPPVPDYGAKESWAALPDMQDMADLVPKKSGLTDNQADAIADVFFIHPTIYTYEPVNEYKWNADVGDYDLNQKVDASTIKNQATVFNGSCKVYAPRYRQAHYSAFTTDDKSSADSALDLAYQDVKAAFQYYLDHFHQNRPIIIASHSQGTVHARQLLKEFFDGKDLQKYLVEAYLVGIAIRPDAFETIKPSETAEQCGGFVSWNTFITGFYPPYYKNGLDKALCTNPLTWSVSPSYADRFENHGAVGLKFKMIRQAVDAENKDGLLWIHKPHVPGKMFLKMKIWHRADYNLYWMNIRENVALRLSTYLSNSKLNEK